MKRELTRNKMEYLRRFPDQRYPSFERTNERPRHSEWTMKLNKYYYVIVRDY